jgi:MraZ protein
MFIGEYRHTIDTKGRVMMPAKFREELGLSFYVTKGMDGCLFVYSELEWQKMDAKITSLQLSRKEARGFSRLFYAGAMNTSLDRQGRVLIPQNLRDYSGIEKDVVIIGVSDRIEIWSQEKWDIYNDEEFLNYETLTEKMEDLNF